jgi:hypothetical protein
MCHQLELGAQLNETGSTRRPNFAMATARAVSADLAKLPPEDDDHSNIPDVQAACDAFEKWFAASTVPWDGSSPFTQEGLVEIAEMACRVRQDFAAAGKALTLFFTREPVRNQVRNKLRACPVETLCPLCRICWACCRRSTFAAHCWRGLLLKQMMQRV